MEHRVDISPMTKSEGESEQLDFLIVSPRLTIEAMRDTGYKDTDHALAELIDNSVEAGAGLVEVVAVETPPDPEQRYARARVTEIAVCDNGEGMDWVTLRRALKFGDGTRLSRNRRGIGRFGVGLPQSSISQCLRVDVWSWQNGVDNALHSFLDLREIMATGQQRVPEPQHSPVPQRWRAVARNGATPTGTLVVWSSLDRVRWSGGAWTLGRTGALCGRIYRKFLTDDARRLGIDLVLARSEAGHLEAQRRESCQVNDPLYLTTPSSTPTPFNDTPMFSLYNERKWSIPIGDLTGEIHVRCTMARADAINERKSVVRWPKSYKKAGDAPWGKHAERNKGVSVVRARRELEVSLAWVNNYEPEERWWSVEVEFSPVLDEVFGVVNNKQHAHGFVQGAGFKWEEMADEGETFGLFRERLEETSDPRAHLVDVWIWIDDQIRRMRKERVKLMAGTGTPRHPKTGEEVEDVATKEINEQKERGETGDTDHAAAVSRPEKIEQLTQSALRFSVDERIAHEWAEETVKSGRRVLVKEVNLGHRDAFFNVESVSDVIEIWLNDRHPIHDHLLAVVAGAIDDEDKEQLVARLQKAAFTFRMLLIAWARHEDKAPAGLKEGLADARMDWGREARKFLSAIES